MPSATMQYPLYDAIQTPSSGRAIASWQTPKLVNLALGSRLVFFKTNHVSLMGLQFGDQHIILAIEQTTIMQIEDNKLNKEKKDCKDKEKIQVHGVRSLQTAKIRSVLDSKDLSASEGKHLSSHLM